MASLALRLLLLISSASAWNSYHVYYGGSVTFTPKGQNSDGAYLVELRNKQTNEYCIQNYFRCSGNCGTQTTSSITTVSQNSYGYTWCHREVVWQGEIHGNQPFDIRYPTNFLWHNGEGYWASNTHSFRTGWSLGAHFDLGTRSDTGESNRSPTITSTPPLRITQNCPRRYSLPAFDHDGDAVRCRFGTSRESDVCGLCYQPEGFTLDQDSCTLSYTYTRSLGNSAFELIVEDFPRERITLSYSDGSYTLKRPSVGGRHRRDVTTDTTLSPFPFNSAPTATHDATSTTATTTTATTTDATNRAATSTTATTTTATTTDADAANRAATTTDATTTDADATNRAATTTDATTATTRAATTTTATTRAATTTTATTRAATTTTATTRAATTTDATTATTTTATTTDETTATTRAATTTTATTRAATTTDATTATTRTATTTDATTRATATTTATTRAATTTTQMTTDATTRAATTPDVVVTNAITETTAARTTDATTTTETTTDATITTETTTDATTTTETTTDATTTTETTTDATTTTTTTTASTLQTTSRPFLPTIAPLSRLPLQFTVHVDSHHAPSCLDGDYFPIFLSPTPRNGVNLPAFVNQTLEIRVRATAVYTRISDLIVSGPAGTSKHRNSTEEFTIRWTPTENEVNDHFAFCFYFEATDRHNRVYQSELRCVTADVGHHDTVVHCNVTSMMVEVEKSYLIRRNERSLHLKDFSAAACSLQRLSNRTHLVAVMSLNACGTTLEEEGDNLVFKNEITSADPSATISRQHDVEIVFSCVYPKRTNLTLGFRHKNPYAFTERGFGAFSFQFEFFESQRFRTQVDASTYPVEVNLKQMMFMQIEATSSIPNTELFVESCRATPYDNPNSRISYTIIEHGCVRDGTVQIYSGSNLQFRFGMEAFEFIGAYDEVYITCSVILCETGVPGTRCSQGCIRSGGHRTKREAAAQTSSHSISQGPLHLLKSPDSQASLPSLNLSVNLAFVATFFLACGAVVYHSRTSKPKYQLLPSAETG